MWRSLVAVLLLFVSACAHGPGQGSGPRVVVSSTELARQAGLKPWAISMPFGANEDGSDLLLKFLDRAEASGARFVTQLQVVFVTQEEGQSLECRSRLSPDGIPPEARQARVRMASVTGKPLVALQRVVQSYSESVVSCREVVVPGAAVASSPRAYSKSDPSIASAYVSEVRQRTAIQCLSTPVMRYRYRYGFEAAAGYTPLNARRLLAVRPDLSLAQSEAECVPRAPDAPRNNRLEAIAFGGAGPEAALLTVPEEVAGAAVEL
ncbi:hypothetical protein LZ198_16305 [Myxococcus sp. K15C18031901]|uniref:hypothetical protein n=1 Tax=Myxococcus dinghuensis TaxID=2906761 RepID=UPI0020A70D8E|nr:hypothetical protein [Myxococcus dinghuensis]MCP3100433.1 hypothetical protein [Myxococcus dinghuensis]